VELRVVVGVKGNIMDSSDIGNLQTDLNRLEERAVEK
jgi:hypothetical protein